MEVGPGLPRTPHCVGGFPNTPGSNKSPENGVEGDRTYKPAARRQLFANADELEWKSRPDNLPACPQVAKPLPHLAPRAERIQKALRRRRRVPIPGADIFLSPSEHRYLDDDSDEDEDGDDDRIRRTPRSRHNHTFPKINMNPILRAMHDEEISDSILSNRNWFNHLRADHAIQSIYLNCGGPMGLMYFYNYIAHNFPEHVSLIKQYMERPIQDGFPQSSQDMDEIFIGNPRKDVQLTCLLDAGTSHEENRDNYITSSSSDGEDMCMDHTNGIKDKDVMASSSRKEQEDPFMGDPNSVSPLVYLHSTENDDNVSNFGFEPPVN